ncbi:hypothetical protein [Ancylobacter sp.]|uniref:hypothetical protein n=1 Tax=Ancylobacter sp. TaxID=1872567 RepID=UPI003D13D1BD
MSDDTVTPLWTLTRVSQVDGTNLSLTREGESVPKMEITPDGRTTFNTSVTVSGRVVVGDTVSAAKGPVTIAGGLSVNGEATAQAGLAVKGRLTVAGSIEAAEGLAGPGAVPVGAILMWSGNPATLPSGWFLCNGGGWLPNGDPIPDLRGRFIVGHDPGDKDYARLHAKGGSPDRTLTVANLPKDDMLTVKQLVVSVPYIDGDNNALSRNVGRDVKIGSNGASQPFDIRPPWHALAYIIYGGPGARVSADPNMRAVLRNGEFLSEGQFVASPSGRYALLLAKGGRLMLQDMQDAARPRQLWIARKGDADATGTRAIQQADGNFVLYHSAGNVSFAAGTYGKGVLLKVTDEGKVTIDNAEGSAAWSRP